MEMTKFGKLFVYLGKISLKIIYYSLIAESFWGIIKFPSSHSILILCIKTFIPFWNKDLLLEIKQRFELPNNSA